MNRTPPKPRPCRVCRETYTPTRMGQVVCSPACAAILGQRKRQEADTREARKARREYRENDRAWLTKQAQQAVNAYVLERDRDQPCISCDKNPYRGVRHAGHFIAVGAEPALRFEPDNINAQCYSCNCAKSGNPIPYRAALVRKIGVERVEWLEKNHAPRCYTKDDLREIARVYRAKRKERVAKRGAKKR